MGEYIIPLGIIWLLYIAGYGFLLAKWGTTEKHNYNIYSLITHIIQTILMLWLTITIV
jgi:hypothetical protein